VRMWAGTRAEQAGERAEFQTVSMEMKQFACSLVQPYCGPATSAEAAGWFGEAAPHIRSVAFMALREPGAAASEGACIGLLVLGSEDPMRFYPEMGTLYLKRLGELVGAGLARFL
jgi:uncharacterized protein